MTLGKFAYFVIGFVVAAVLFGSGLSSEIINSTNSNLSSTTGGDDIFEGGEVSLRSIKQEPVRYEGRVVTVEGGSNSFADFIKSGGYQLPLDCSDYSGFDYASQFRVKVVVELENPGESDPRLRCVEAPVKTG